MGVAEWLGGERRETKPLLMKIGAAVSLSFASYLFYRLNSIDDRHGRASAPGARGSKSSPKDRILLRRLLGDGTPNVSNGGAAAARMSSDAVEPSPSRKNFGEDGGCLLQQFHMLMLGGLGSPEMEAEICGKQPPKISPGETERRQEIAYLKGLVQSLQERERSLEDQLLEYYGLEEQDSIVAELQNRLKISGMEAELLSVRIDSLQAEKQRLEQQLSGYSATKAELESARTKISNLKRKLETESADAKESITALHEKVSALRDLERREEEYRQMERSLERLGDLEREVAEIREMNSKLVEENKELSKNLRIAAEFSQTSEESQEAMHLRQRNHEMAKEIEQLQNDRCADVEELVYLRWINACLRHELRNYHLPPGKTTARDLSRTLSPKSEQKVKQLINEYANPGCKDGGPSNPPDFEWESCSSSQASSQTESGEPEDTSIDTSTATNGSGAGKTKFLAKLKRLVLRKDTRGSPKSGGKSARRSTIPASWFAETIAEDSGANSASGDHYEHNLKYDSAWTRNLPRVSLDFRRLRSHDDQANASAGASRSKSDVGETWRMRGALSEQPSLRSRLGIGSDEEAVDALEKFSKWRHAAAPEKASPRKTTKGRARSTSFSCGGNFDLYSP